MTRLSEYLLPTLKDPPADAEAVSHQLMVRAGLIRQVGAGMWSYLPAGLRVIRKIEAIIREEMNGIGGLEVLLPVLQPAELWKRTGRYEIDELFKLQDRRGAEMVLAMTHEENLTFHVANEVRSYRDLPLLLYQLQTKERDEPRPRARMRRSSWPRTTTGRTSGCWNITSGPWPTTGNCRSSSTTSLRERARMSRWTRS